MSREGSHWSPVPPCARPGADHSHRARPLEAGRKKQLALSCWRAAVRNRWGGCYRHRMAIPPPALLETPSVIVALSEHGGGGGPPGAGEGDFGPHSVDFV